MKEETIIKYKKILGLMKDHPSYSKSEIASMADTSPRTVNRALDWEAKHGNPTANNPTVADLRRKTYEMEMSNYGKEDVYDGTPEPRRYEEGYPKYVLTKLAIVIMFSPQDEPVLIDQSHVNFEMVVEAAKDGDWDYVEENSTIKKAITSFSLGAITLEGDDFRYNGFNADNSLSRYIIHLLKQGEEPLPLINFLDNVMGNPDPRAVSEIYDFIKACDLPITEDGCFIAYKKVRSNYTDCHTGKLDNSVGAKPKMPRSMVDTNKHNTCSKGLHFCSKSYLSCFGGDKIMAVKINPADVVAIPADYNNAKGRTWTYEVVAELEAGEDLPSYFIAGF